MQYPKKLCQLVFVTIGTLYASTAFAEGTDVGVVVTNDVTLDFQVNAIAQTTTTSTDFTVDRKLILEVVTQNGDWVTVIPSQTSATDGSVNALDYLITNRSNDATNVEIALIDQSATAVTGFSAQVGVPTPFLPTPPTGDVWHDVNDNDIVDGGEVAVALDVSGVTVFSIGPLAEDATANIKVVVDVAVAALNDEYRTFTLVAAVADGGGTALPGDDSGNAAPGGASVNILNGISTVETVFADGLSANAEDVQYDFVTPAVLGTLDAFFDGQSVDTSGFITAVALSIGKYVQVIYDPISLNRWDAAGLVSLTDPKAIPGSVLMYVIGVVNANTSLSATVVEVDDDVPDAALEVLEGDQANPAGAIQIPASVTFPVGGVPTLFTLDQANIESDLDLVWDQDCGAVLATSTAFLAGDPELIDISLGACAPGEIGYVVYFVTINDAP